MTWPTPGLVRTVVDVVYFRPCRRAGAPGDGASTLSYFLEKPLILIGPMGAGKSTIARCLGAALGVVALDVDDKITELAGQSIADIFATSGEAEFRRIETEALRYCLDSGWLIATGGGITGEERNLELLRRGFVIYLYAPVRVQLQRTSTGVARPMLSGHDRRSRLTELFAQRHARYASAADLTFDTSRLPARQCTLRLIDLLGACDIIREEA